MGRGFCEKHQVAGCICLMKNNPRNTAGGWTKVPRTHCLKGHELIAENVSWTKHGHRLCKICRILKDRAWQQRHPEKFDESVRRSRRKVLYGVTEEKYNLMFEKQKGLCAICKKPPTENGRFSIDHNHKTDEIRGLIHRVCNTGIGNLQDSAELCRAAAEYLDNPPARGLW
jgi:hypothetical protein